MKHIPATYVVIEPRVSHNPLASRFSRTLGIGHKDGLYALPHPEVPLHPNGTSSHAILYALGHKSKTLSPVTQITPRMLRQLRGLIHYARTKEATLHLFGLIDNHSPFGSRRAMEEIIRILSPSGIRIKIHAGVWHPTPKEFTRGLHEMKTFCHGPVTLGSLFPLTSVRHNASAKQYLDGILHPHTWHNAGALSLPMQHPYVFDDEDSSPHDLFLVVNHSLHGFDLFEQILEDMSPSSSVALEHEHSLDQGISQALDRSKHVLVASNVPSFTEAYFGTEPHHPYFESLHNSSSIELLEMLISPHFGYHQQPYRTVVLLREEPSPEFDWLLSSFIKQHRGDAYYCCFLFPHSLSGNLLFSNMPLSPGHSLYRQLHSYV